MKVKLFLVLAILVIGSLLLIGCAGTPDTDEPAGDEDVTTETSVLKLGYVQWACANANSHMVKAVLEDKYDVQVDLVDMEAGLLWQSVATGDIDFMVTAWLPYTHEAYYEELKDQFVDLGPLYEGARIGLVVPAYVEANSIAELNDYVDEFNGQIVGIDAGAGIMKAANQAIEDYGLNYNLITSSDPAMCAELNTAYDANEWIVVTGWAPHWKFGAFDLKFLDDPEGSFGGEETINSITRLDFADDYPEINAFLDNYHLSVAEFGSLIDFMEDYEDDDEAAQAWVRENQELVDSWFE